MCVVDELLVGCDKTNINDNSVCCISGSETSLCSSYTGVSIGSTANYTTSHNYCILSHSLVERTCLADLSWSGEMPTFLKGKA